MRQVFADAGFYIALLNPKEQLHQRALELSKTEKESLVFTSEFILIEVLNLFSERSSALRRTAVEFCSALHHRTDTRLIPATSELYRRALEFYGQRQDKTWSLSDCSSFLCMEDHGLREALAHDHDFVEAGYVALLR